MPLTTAHSPEGARRQSLRGGRGHWTMAFFPSVRAELHVVLNREHTLIIFSFLKPCLFQSFEGISKAI